MDSANKSSRSRGKNKKGNSNSNNYLGDVMKSTSTIKPVKEAPKTDMKDVKTTGIKIRGTGAATKGTMARGPMA